MKIAYLILAHTNAEQLLRLIKRLRDRHVNFFIHVDKKCDFLSFNRLISRELYPDVYFTKREKCNWGRIGVVKAILHALKVIVNSDENYDYIILLSGQDYPIKSNAYINDYLEKNYGKIFMKISGLPYDKWNDEYACTDGGMNRIKQYHLMFIGRPYVYPSKEKIKTIKGKLLNMLFSFWFTLPRRLPGNLKPFGGPAWWAIPRNSADYILDFTRNHPEYLRDHEYTLIPSEMFFQTIIANSKNKDIADNLTYQNLHYCDWNYKKNPDNPKTLRAEDLTFLMNTDKLFARKFDINIDSKILDLIDEKLGLVREN